VVPAPDHPEVEDVEMEPAEMEPEATPGPSTALTMDDHPMPDAEDLDDMPTLEEADDDEEFHSLMEDALMETLPEESSTDTSMEGDATPTKPPVEFSRFAMEKPGPSVESPICSKPKPFVLRPPTLPGPAKPPTRGLADGLSETQREAMAQIVAGAMEDLKWKNVLNPFRKPTRSNTKIEGDPTRVYLPTRTSKKK
jgi:hypothetical protein